jgi:hypothetical protein
LIDNPNDPVAVTMQQIINLIQMESVFIDPGKAGYRNRAFNKMLSGNSPYW